MAKASLLTTLLNLLLHDDDDGKGLGCFKLDTVEAEGREEVDRLVQVYGTGASMSQ